MLEPAEAQHGNRFGALTPPSKPPLSPPSPPHPFQTDLRAPRRKTDANIGERTRSQGRGLPQPREGGRLGHVSRVAGGSISHPQENFSLMEGLESYPWSGGAVLKGPDLVARGCSHVCPSRLSTCRPWAPSPGSSSLQRPSQAALGQCQRQFLHASCPPLGPRPLTMLQHQPRAWIWERQGQHCARKGKVITAGSLTLRGLPILPHEARPLSASGWARTGKK